MSELIDRQAAIDAVNNAFDRETLLTGFVRSIAVRAIRDMPSVQPEPHEGHWINGKCDLCGEHAPFWAMASTYHESKYCPNCGTKMKGERQK